MALGFLAALFGPRIRLPHDRTRRLPGRAKRAAAPSIGAMKDALDKISALPGIADIKEHKRVPRGFAAHMADFLRAVDDFHASVRPFASIPDDATRQGEPGGTGPCHAAPLGLHAVEALNIYRTVRQWRDFPAIAKRMAELGEQQFKDIQAGHAGKDPGKIRMATKAVQLGRIAFAKRMQPCPMLDVGKQRCRIWNERPLVCRMHYVTGAPEASSPDHPAWPGGAQLVNIRLPVRQQVVLAQLDKRLMLELNPFMYASLLQLLELAGGQMLQEVGEAPQRMQQDGVVAQRANRNVAHAKKFKKKRR
jgi:Fe-S-cluster containining protein